jgi:hypothetical protein
MARCRGARSLSFAWVAIFIELCAEYALPSAAQAAPLEAGVHRPLKPFPVTVWTNTSAGFMHPEFSQGPFGIPALQSKLSLGLAQGGGGMRAASVAAGTLRALHMVSPGVQRPATRLLGVQHSAVGTASWCHPPPPPPPCSSTW